MRGRGFDHPAYDTGRSFHGDVRTIAEMVGRVVRAALTIAFFIELRLRGVVNRSRAGLRGKKPRVRNAGTMSIGRNFRVLGRVIRTQLGTGPDGKLIIGDHVGINEGVSIFALDEIRIDDYAMIADYVSIADATYHDLAPGLPARTAPVHIERNVWLGRNVVVLPGVTIGANSVVAAGAVVTRDVAPNTLVGGVPARFMRALDIPDPANYTRRGPY
jgi:acetyltransferase-like isoleucine patch superfamily enzyme